MPGVSSSANCLDASCAAARRFGDTSVARIDCDTSMTSITTARLRGIRTSCVGPAIATVSSTSDDHQQDRGQVPPPRRPLRRHAFQQFHVREAQHPPVPGQLHDDVQRDDRRARPRGTGRTTRVRNPTTSSVRATVMSCAQSLFVKSILGAAGQRAGGGSRRTGPRRRSSPGRCAGRAAARRSAAASAPPRRGAPPRPSRSRRAAVRRW